MMAFEVLAMGAAKCGGKGSKGKGGRKGGKGK